MNFDDRLRNHLQDQHDEMTIAPSGIEDVQARSARRKQKRLAATTLGICAIALAAFAAMTGLGSNRTEFATGGAEDAPTTTAPERSSDDVVPAETAELERTLPEPGEALTLAAASNVNAPGGFSFVSSGADGGVYYVVSTAPGLRFEDLDPGEEFPRPATVYAFDGSSWSNTTITGDRFVSGITNGSTGGVLYAVSTGTPTDSGLNFGTSTNLGTDWDWTPIDLTAVFGPDMSTWPQYVVSYATHGSQHLVIVNSSSQADYDEAFKLAVASGAKIDRVDDVLSVDETGIAWFDNSPIEIDPDEPVNCAAVADRRSMELWQEAEVIDYASDFDGEFSSEEATELDPEFEAFLDENDAQAKRIQDQMLETVREYDECTTFADCLAELYIRQNEVGMRVTELYEEAGISQLQEPDAALIEAVDELYESATEATDSWLDESGCSEQIDLYGETDHAERERYATWEELGVTAPNEWNPIRHAFLVDGDDVSSLGSPFGEETGYLVEVSHDGDAWNVVLDSPNFTVDSEPTFTQWTSIDGQAWESAVLDDYYYHGPTNIVSGTRLSIGYMADAADIIATGPDGTSKRFAIEDLAPGLDTDEYYISDISTGEYGAVAWAVEWDRDGFNSVLLYSPDGSGWGATEVPGMEITNAIVGQDGVLVFVNDPAREEGTPQPVFLANA